MLVKRKINAEINKDQQVVWKNRKWSEDLRRFNAAEKHSDRTERTYITALTQNIEKKMHRKKVSIYKKAGTGGEKIGGRKNPTFSEWTKATEP